MRPGVGRIDPELLLLSVPLRKRLLVENQTTAVADSAEAPAATPTSDVDPGVVIETRTLSQIYRDFWGRKKVHAL